MTPTRAQDTARLLLCIRRLESAVCRTAPRGSAPLASIGRLLRELFALADRLRASTSPTTTTTSTTSTPITARSNDHGQTHHDRRQ
jgi:hypothetical protein